MLTVDPILQAYRTDRVSGAQRICPQRDGDLICDEVGYTAWSTLGPPGAAAAAKTAGDSGSSSGLIIVIVVVVRGARRDRVHRHPAPPRVAGGDRGLI